MISYAPFWNTLELYSTSTYELIKKNKISSSTINKLRHGQPISTRSIEKLCAAIGCNVEDILEYHKDSLLKANN